MFGIGLATKVYVAVGPTDMRKGFEGLYGLVREQGAVHGNIDASDRVNISSEGSLIGNCDYTMGQYCGRRVLQGGIDIPTPF